MKRSAGYLDRLNREIQYGILPEIGEIEEASDLNLERCYQAREDQFPEIETTITRSPSQNILSGAKAAVTYEVTYDGQKTEFTAYTDGENLGLEVEDNGSAASLIKELRGAALDRDDGKVNGDSLVITDFLSY